MMIERDESRRTENETAMTAQDRLRSELLTCGLCDWVPMAEVMTAITHYHLAETVPAQQDLALRAIRSLLEDGLVQLGDLPDQDGKFPAWDLSIEAAIERLHDRFVRHYDDPTQWEFSIWLGLTDSGERTATALKTAETIMNAQDRLRTELLTSGLYDLVPMAQVESVITGDHLAATTSDQQALALSVVRSLVADGLMDFVGWDELPLDEAMARVHDLFINHYDDPGTWAFAIWLRLTEAGQRTAEELKATTPE
jgi:hypothetical protein